MPKRIKVINRFDGGINTKSNAKDIADNELVEAKNVYVDQIGTLKSGGKAEANTSDYSAQAGVAVKSGYGFYQSVFDYNDAGTNQPTVKNFIAHNNTTTPYSSTLYDSESSGSWSNNINLTGQQNQKIIYHIADGAVRICDSALTGVKIKWYGFVKRQHFKGLSPTADVTYNEYVLTDNKISAPTYLNSIALWNGLSAGTGFNVSLVDGGTDGYWEKGTYDIASSFIYDGNQESLLKVKESAITLSTDGRKLSGYGVYCIAPFPERISGSRIYIRKNNTDDPWTLLYDISLADGIRTQLNAEYTAWGSVSANDISVTSIESEKPNLDTYETINGYSPDEQFVSFDTNGMGYKTSVVANGRTFIANVKIKNEDGEEVHMPDRIMYSQVGKYDIFPTSNYVDLGVNDGDEFIKLEAFADRLFAYKKNKLYIINIGGGSDTQWFVESEYSSLGVKSPNATTKADLGIVWANENGLYFYDGSRVMNLQSKIDDSTWHTFCSGAELTIGFLPKKKEIVILKGTSTGDNDAYIYHMPTKSFIFVDKFLPDGYTFSNMILDSNGKLSVFGSGATDQVYSYDGSQVSSSDGSVTFKFDDFGDPFHLKKFYKVILNYNSTDDQSTPLSYNSISSSGSESGGSLTGNLVESDETNPLTVSKLKEFTFTSDGKPLTAQAVELTFTPSTTSSKWQINDITLVYRPIIKKVSL